LALSPPQILLRHRLESLFIPQGTEQKQAKDYRNSEEIFAGGGLLCRRAKRQGSFS
jgi:hypothetical protein